MRARVCRACSWRSVESYRRRCPLTFAIVSSYHAFSHPSIPRMNYRKERRSHVIHDQRGCLPASDRGGLQPGQPGGCRRAGRGSGGDGTEGAKNTIKYLRSAFADFHITIDELVAVGDKVWARQRGGGTNVGSFAGRPPTGKTAFIDVIDVARFEDGKMVEHWGVADQLGMMHALGLIPSR